MKRKYKMTPDQYIMKYEKMKDITYKTGYDGVKNADRCSEYQKEQYDKYNKETKDVEVPVDKFYFNNETIYNLYLNRNEYQPITSKELYSIIETLRNNIDSCIRTATYN